MEQKSTKRIPGYHPITTQLIDILSEGKPGDIKTDKEMRRLVGQDVGVGTRGYAYLHSAIRYLERDGVVWQRSRGEQLIVCLDASQKVDRVECNVRTVRRVAKRAARVIHHIRQNDLPLEKRMHAAALGAQLGAIALLSRRESTEKLIGAGERVPQIGDTMRLFEK